MDSVIHYAEYAWQVQVEEWGLEAPPPDYGGGSSTNPDDRYDIYLVDISGSGVLGYTSPDQPVPDATYPNKYSSYIVIDPNENSDIYTLRNTIVHEFNHACQMSYDVQEGGWTRHWWLENCAVWSQENSLPDDNEYLGYVNWGSSPIGTPNYQITSARGLYWYGGVVWPMFLAPIIDNGWVGDTDFIRKAWDRMGQNPGYHPLADLDWTLQNYYLSSLEEALSYYALWRLFVGSRYENGYIHEADLYREQGLLASHNSLPASGNSDLRPIYAPGGADYIRVYVGDADTLTFSVDGEDGYIWKAWVVGYEPGASNPSEVWEFPLESNDHGDIMITPVAHDTFFLVVTCVNWYSDSIGPLSFEYGIAPTGVKEGPTVQRDWVYYYGGQLRYSMTGSSPVEVMIYDPAGRVVRSWRDLPSQGSLRLDLPAGAYFWRVRSGTADYTGKMMVR